MLLTRAEQWKQGWLEEGLQKGLQAGRQRGLEEGLQEGRQKGLEEGRQAGEADLLLRLLARRFGTLPDAITDRVRSAGIELLEEWGLRTLDAADLDHVFSEPPI
jgi:flagellar biosynthesis/type III secretory pathway protein FliH